MRAARRATAHNTVCILSRGRRRNVSRIVVCRLVDDRCRNAARAPSEICWRRRRRRRKPHEILRVLSCLLCPIVSLPHCQHRSQRNRLNNLLFWLSRFFHTHFFSCLDGILIFRASRINMYTRLRKVVFLYLQVNKSEVRQGWGSHTNA